MSVYTNTLKKKKTLYDFGSLMHVMYDVCNKHDYMT